MPATFSSTGSTGSFLLPDMLGIAPDGGSFQTGLLNVGTPYATNGVAVTAATFLAGATVITEVIFDGVSADGSISLRLNAAKDKVLAFNRAGNEIANATDLSGAGFSVRCMGVVY